MDASVTKGDSGDAKVGEMVPEILKEDIELAKAAIEEGKQVILNDDNQIVDKRQLLRAGLNVVKKPVPPKSSETDTRQREYEEYQHRKREEERRKRGSGPTSAKERERLSHQIETQLLETQKTKEEEERRKEEAMIEKMKKRTTEEAAMDAKSRYLARKKAKTLG